MEHHLSDPSSAVPAYGFLAPRPEQGRDGGLSRWAFLLVKRTEPTHRGSRTFNDLYPGALSVTREGMRIG